MRGKSEKNRNLEHHLTLESKSNFYVLFWKSTKSVGTFRWFPHPLSTLAVVKLLSCASDDRKGVFSPRYRQFPAVSGGGDTLDLVTLKFWFGAVNRNLFNSLIPSFSGTLGIVKKCY